MIYHLGPLGALYELPPIESDQSVDNPGMQPIATHTSLEGATSTDELGPVRRTWTLPWVYLDADQFDLLDSLRRGLLGRPLRLIDPNLANLAAVAVATGGSERRRVGKDWATATGVLDWAPLARPPAGTRVRGGILWTRPTTVGDVLSTGRARLANRLPILDEVTEVAVGSRVLRTSAGATLLNAGLDYWDSAGNLSTVWADAVVPATPADGTDTTVALTVPPGVVAFAPCWRVTDGQPTSTFVVTAVRAGYGPTPPAPSVGGGTALVRVTDLPAAYPSEGEWNPSMSLLEL